MNNNHDVVGSRDELIIVKLEPSDSMESNESNAIEKLRFEKEILSKENENAELRAVIEKMKYEKEKLATDLQVEKLKSENALLKAEKQYGIDVKTLLERKRQIEDQLESVQNKKAKLNEEKTKFEEEIKVLKERSQKLVTSNNKLQTEKIKFENWYNLSKREKESLAKQKNSLQKQVINMKGTIETLNCKKDVNLNLLEKAILQGSFNRLPLPKLLVVGIPMFLRGETSCFTYQYWYENIMERMPGNYHSEGQFAWVKGYGVPTASQYVSLGLISPKPESQMIKLLHTTDNTKAKDIEHVRGDKWLNNGLTRDYLHNGFYLIFVYKGPED